MVAQRLFLLFHPPVRFPLPRGGGAGPLRRHVSGFLGLLLLLQAPVALAQGGVRSTTWGALKRSADDPAPVVDRDMTPAEVRAAIRAASRLRPRIVPRVVQSLPLDTGTLYSVSGPSGTDLFATHVVTSDGRRVGTTVFDFARGVIRDASGDRIVWTAPSGDLEHDLRRIYELQDANTMMRTVANTVCNIVLVGGTYQRCMLAIMSTPLGFVACLGLLIAMALMCYLITHIDMPPDPDREIGQPTGP